MFVKFAKKEKTSNHLKGVIIGSPRVLHILFVDDSLYSLKLMKNIAKNLRDLGML